jgi:hypothetical protein
MSDNTADERVEIENETYNQYYMAFQDYPAIFNYKLTENMKEDFDPITETPTTTPTSIPTNTSTPTIPAINPEFSKGPGLNKNMAGIIIGVIIGGFLLLLSYFLDDFSDYESDYSIIYKMIIFAFVAAIFICVIFVLAKGLEINNKTPNLFNCNIIKGSNNPVLTINALQIQESIINKLKLNVNNPVCPYSNIQNDYFIINSNNIKPIFMKFSFIFPIIILLITFYGIFFSESPFDFMLYKGGKVVKFIILLSLVITSVGLIISTNTIIKHNKMMYQSNNVQTFKNRVDKISDTDNRLTDEEKTKLYTILQNNKLTPDAIVVADTTSDLKKNKITKHSDDGVVLFTHIIVMSMLLLFFISIVSQYELDTTIFNLSFDKGIKIILLFLLLIISMIVMAGITNPWLLNDDDKKADKKSVILSTVLPILFITVISIIMTISNNV